jgi:hypothetical protein
MPHPLIARCSYHAASTVTPLAIRTLYKDLHFHRTQTEEDSKTLSMIRSSISICADCCGKTV